MSLHIIDRVNVTVDCREDDARAVQQLVSAAIRTAFAPRAGALFDASEGDLVIERLDVDVGTCTLAELSRNLVDGTLAELGAAVERDARSGKYPLAPPKPVLPRRTGSRFPTTPVEVETARVEAASEAESEGRAAAFGMPFLSWERGVPPETKRLAVRLENHLSGRRGARPPKGLRTAILRDCRAAPACWAHFLAHASLAPIVHDRLLRAFDPGERRAIVAALLAAQPSAVRRAMAGLTDIWPLQPVLMALFLGLDRDDIDLAGSAGQLVDAAAKSVTLAAQFAACRGLPGDEALAEAAGRLRHMLEKDAVPAGVGARMTPLSAPGDMGVRPPVATDAVGVDNAGAILLWPFLPRFFDALDLVKNGGFVDAAAAARAAALLDGLIWGDMERDVRRTGLTALLCGLPLDQPLDAPESGDRERELFGDLLARVTAMAPSLHKLSEADLLGLLLRRPGTVSRAPASGGLVVAVEPHPADILLAELPWPLETIMLPWLAGALAVHWPSATAKAGAALRFESPGDEG